MNSPLTWDAVLKLVDAAGPGGITNQQIAAALNVDDKRVAPLTLVMTEAGAIERWKGAHGHWQNIYRRAKKRR